MRTAGLAEIQVMSLLYNRHNAIFTFGVAVHFILSEK